MANIPIDEGHLIAKAGAVLTAISIIVTLFLTVTQTWLCRNGIRLACTDKFVINNVTFRHQYLPRSADATAILGVLVGKSPTDGSVPQPIHCDDPDDLGLTIWERNYSDSNIDIGLIRGVEDYVLGVMDFSYPGSNIAFEITIDVTIREPRSNPSAGIKSNLWPEFGEGNLVAYPPGQQHIKVISPANSNACKLTFLVVPFDGRHGQHTENWNPGKYIVDVNVSDGIQAYQRSEFEIK